MGALVSLILRTLGWTAAGYVANDVIEVVKERNDIPIQSNLENKARQYLTGNFWLNAGIVAAVGTVIVIAKMTKAQRKKIL